MKMRFGTRRKRDIPFIYLLATLAAGTIHSPAIAKDVGAYISRNGGCSAFGNSWEREFHRRDEVRYGKTFNDWNERDYQELKSWILRCMDPWVAVPGRREVYLRNVEDRLRSFDKTRIRQNEILANRLAAEARFKEQQQQIAAIDAQFTNQAEIARAAAGKFDHAATTYLATFKSGINLSELDASEAEGKKVEALLIEAREAISAARSIATNLEQKGGPRRYMPDLEQANAFGRRLKRIATVKIAKENCLPVLEQAGIPRNFASTPILAGSGADDPFFFELMCPTTSDNLQLIKPGLLSELFKLNVGRVVTTTLWFELRQNNNKPGLGRNESNRLILRRLRTKTVDVSADSDWESVNLLNGTLAMMLMIR